MTEKETEEKECLLYCGEEPDGDKEACKVLCLSASAAHHSLFHRALRQAAHDGLNDAEQHIFAAGYVSGWLKRNNQ